ncbi:MAG: dicarboxylate/amino acid:cation symporter [Puniceicoccales bacterium]|jgi:Na+/H+-dicarboxylate symporter|nr:dicarboxylate/amino acid:cation symporter [Puniceicoccales bacterium]
MKLGKMPFLLLFIMFATPFIEPVMCLSGQRFFLGISLAIKEIILFLLPFVIFMLLFGACVYFSKNAPRIIARILLLICLSNLVTTSVGSGIGLLFYKAPMAFASPSTVTELLPLFAVRLPVIIRNDLAMLSGILAGILLPRYFTNFSQRANEIFIRLIAKILRAISYSLPAFIFGFTLKICHEGSLVAFFRNYAVPFGIVIVVSLLYILFLYAWAVGFSGRVLCRCVKNMIPAVSCAFCTMSSAATMPITIECVGRNGRDKTLARSMVPMSANVHLIGNNFTIAILAFAIMAGHRIPFPSILSIGAFIIWTLVAKFSVVGIPGGSILVMLPILERYLQFNGEMCSTVFAINMFACPIITALNVLGNGAFALLAEKLCILQNSRPQN